jgi:nicotinate-nucleotide adenylyltransferase
MKVGLFFGSFNPIHTGHLIIANHIANYYTDKVWFIVSPQNPFKEPNKLLKAESRLSLVQIAINNDNRFEASDFEFKLPTPSYTINTLKALVQQYVDYEFVIIIGSDNFKEISGWKSASEVISKYKFLIYERPGFSITNTFDDNQILKAPLLNISSTEIRNLIANNKCFKYLVPEKVYKEIKEQNYFK